MSGASAAVTARARAVVVHWTHDAPSATASSSRACGREMRCMRGSGRADRGRVSSAKLSLSIPILASGVWRRVGITAEFAHCLARSLASLFPPPPQHNA